MCTAGKSAKERRGTVAVEVAVIALPLLLLIFWILEFGRLVMVEQVLTNAAREGARRAVLEHMTASQVRTQVLQYLGQTSVPGANVDVQPADVPFHLLGFGDRVGAVRPGLLVSLARGTPGKHALLDRGDACRAARVTLMAPRGPALRRPGGRE